MSFRLEKLIENLLAVGENKIVDGILDYINIEGNIFDDLINIVESCKKYNKNQVIIGRKLESLYWFQKELADKIYEQRGEDGKSLIDRIYK